MAHWSPSRWGLSGLTLPLVLRAGRRAAWRVPRRAFSTPGKREVLLVAHSPLMLSWVAEVYEALREDSRVAFAVTSVNGTGESGEVIEGARALGLRYIAPLPASLLYWDCAVFADHAAAQNFRRDIPKVMNFHSLDATKLVPGTNELYRYPLRHMLYRDGTPVYARLLEPGERGRRDAAGACPALQPAVAVVGSVRVDRMLTLVPHRDRIRSQMGFGPSDRVVLIGSTHGTECLMETCGWAIVERAMSLMPAYKWILSTHPVHWPPLAKSRPSIGEKMASFERPGVVVHRQPDSYNPLLVAADAVVTDFGSLALNAAVLNRPMAFVPFPPHVLSNRSIVWQLYEVCPRLETPSELEDVLERLAAYPHARVAQIAAEAVGHVGGALRRIREELCGLLQLSPTPPPGEIGRG